MSGAIIQVEHLSKRYRIGNQVSYGSLRDSIANAVLGSLRSIKHRSYGSKTSESEHIWALKDVSFEVQRGEILGIIGRNGAGKSTLLKILSRITKPTNGRVTLRGRVGSLLEVGTGFHPELTGRENIYLNGAVLGMNRAEIIRKFDEIVDFSEIEKFLDTPVKYYSSGMYMRLAFAVAAHLEPEILLVDEVLAVGDTAFQKKCLGKMSMVASEGRTVLFVSHNLGAVRSLCGHVILIDRGSICAIDTPEKAISIYMRSMEERANQTLVDRSKNHDFKVAHMTEIRFLSENGNPITTAFSGEPLKITISYRAMRPGLRLNFAIGVYNLAGEKLLHLGNEYTRTDYEILPIEGDIICRIPQLPLPEGRYRFNLSIHHANERVDYIESATILEVENGDFYNTGRLPPAKENKILIPYHWYLVKLE